MAQKSGDGAAPPPTPHATDMTPRAIASVIYWMKTTLSHIREQELLRYVPDDDVITLTPNEVAAMLRQPTTSSAWQYNPLDEEMLDEQIGDTSSSDVSMGDTSSNDVSMGERPEIQEQSLLVDGDDNNDVLCQYDIYEGEVIMCDVSDIDVCNVCDDSGIDVCDDGSEDCHMTSNSDDHNDDLLDDLFEGIIDMDMVDC
ncbi:hypothetical protein PV10_08323 [Exophiala mesophila]|uniref:Uncharacterized protein n=1 Tax=Exophiala mesophila TaxID=212818 RepID=A0A0D1WIJ9_EXOME|nr:uncharacterized protein PV10_08323 [Exophiala mesophila]KIV88660.1 hypothetical protein PV10_08323 [Exophiala mesophila]